MSNKKLEFNQFYRSALLYLERYEASRLTLQRVLERKVYRLQEDLSLYRQEIENVLIALEEKGFLNERRYVENQIRILSNSGKSNRFIFQKLKAKGISESMISDVFQASDEFLGEEEKIKIFMRKKCLYMTDYNKKLSRLLRAGFPYETVKKILGENEG